MFELKGYNLQDTRTFRLALASPLGISLKVLPPSNSDLLSIAATWKSCGISAVQAIHIVSPTVIVGNGTFLHAYQDWPAMPVGVRSGRHVKGRLLE